MSNCDLKVEEANNKISIFQSPFPVPENGRIKTWDFLTASKGIVTLLDGFGKVFIPVKSDINGNIVKLTNTFNTDASRNTYLDDMILKEKDTREGIATDALLWLVRGLHFLQRFFELFIEDFENKSEELGELLRIAYTETLRPYHGWLAKQLFGLVVRMSPNRTQFLQNLSANNDVKEEEEVVLSKMNEYTTRLKENVMVVKEFYKHHNLESNEKETNECKDASVGNL